MDDLHLVLEPVDLGVVVQAAITERRHAMSAAGLTVRHTAHPQVLVTGDPDRLHQVVDNLLANSTAYCRPGDSVDVFVEVSADTGVLTVIDSGPGLDDAERVHAFDRRWRGVKARRTTPGSGLGLPIVKAIVGAHGGTVQLSTAEHSGTVVRIELPLHPLTP